MFEKNDSVVTLGRLANACQGTVKGEKETIVSGIAIDSRAVKKGDLFVAIRGEKTDGHGYIASAIEKGAAAILCERIPEEIDGKTASFLLTNDSVSALGKMAADYRRQQNPTVVGITGSVGKTTTKEFVASVLAQKYQTHKTSGNYNSAIGLPISVLTMPDAAEMLVLEMGMCEKGEISYLTQIARPQFAVITNIGNSHIEMLGSRENIRDAKWEITEGLSSDGFLLLNGDEPLLKERSNQDLRTLCFSVKDSSCEIYADHIQEDQNSCRFDLTLFGCRMTDLQIPCIGIHNVYNACAAAAIGNLLKLKEDEIRKGLLSYRTTGMRQNIYTLGQKGKDEITIIEDCYNAGPESMEASLEVLKRVAEQQNARAIAVLGDMRELGSFSIPLHRKVGKKAAALSLNRLYCLGSEASEIAVGAEPDIETVVLESEDAIETMADLLWKDLHEGDVLLFKASRAMKMERVIEALRARMEGKKAE